MFDFFFDLIASTLAFFYDVYPSYGFAVICLTMTVMVIMTPLTLKSTRSMLQMQRLQPELKAIQTQYRDDRQRMNEELMEFYKENNINPLGGCLPMLIQLPVFLVLFRVVQGITRRVTDFGLQAGWTAGRGAGASDATSIVDHDLPFDPQNLPVDSTMYQDLVGHGAALADRPTSMEFLSLDLSRTPLDVASTDFVGALPYFALIVIVLISSLYQQRQIRGRNTGAQVNPQQEIIMKVLPWMLPVFALTMPAALVVYFVVSNLYRIGQQGYITHSLYKGEDSLGAQARRSRESAQSEPASSRSKGAGGRTTEKKGQPTPKRSDAREGKKPRKGGGAKGGGASKGGRAASGAGRTGKAPTRHGRGGGRVTEPGTQNNKRKR